MKNLSIFKPGRHTAVNGKVIEFTEADLKACAAAYDTAKHEAPLVVGHPKADDPAYGWAKSLAYADGELVAVPDQVEPQFAEMVNAGRFKKISVRLYEPDSPHNPVPGGYYLRHIGFLGAQPPAVKGLKSAEFAEAEEGVVEFAEVTQWTMDSVKTLFRNFREWIISKGTVEEADRIAPAYLIDSIETAAAPKEMPAYTEHQQENDMLTKEQQDKLAADQEQLKKDRAALDAKVVEYAERDKAINAAEEKTRREGIAAFVDTLVKAGKVLPRDQAGLVAYMAGPNEAGTIEFGEGEAKKTTAADAWLKSFLEALPKQVDFNEHSNDDKKTAVVDVKNPKAVSDKAVEYQEAEAKAGRTVSASAAVEHVLATQQAN